MFTNKKFKSNFSQICIMIPLILLTSCGAKEVPMTVPEGAKAGDLVDMQPCTYETGDVEYTAECDTLVVLENRSNPKSRLISLPIMRVRSTGSNPSEPIFRFAGGPGNSNMRFSLTPWFIERHDIVMIGYRGIDGSFVLDCPEVSKFFRSNREDMLSESALDKMSATFIACAERLGDEGIDIDGYTASEIIDDVEAARIALGYEQVKLAVAAMVLVPAGLVAVVWAVIKKKRRRIL